VPMLRSSWYCLGHASGGYHCLPGTDGRGTAVDFQDPYPRDQAQLLAIFNAFLKVEGQLAELIFSGAGFSIKDGRRVPRYAISGHWNHVHVAVKQGVFIKWPVASPAPAPPAPTQTVVKPMYDPPFPIAGKVVASLPCVTGGAWVLTDGGAIYAFGCKDYDAPNRHPEYWNLPGQTAARLEPFNGGYTVVDNGGRRYDYPAH
jgi:hypothetical protein